MLTPVRAAGRIVSHALNELGYVNMEQRRRIIAWEQKLTYASGQLSVAKSGVIED
jgi:DNA-binding LacI/PurR family transcriptional regulator